jgi:uncharacterized membrane protein (UPF0136 family)
MQGLLDLWRREPALITGFVQAILVLAVAFGLNVTVEQQGAILAFTAAALALVGAGITRSRVTPV